MNRQATISILAALVAACAPVGPIAERGESQRNARELLAPPLQRLELRTPTPKRLPNGVTVIAINDQRAPLVTFQIRLRGAGRHHDPVGSPGIAAAVAATLQETLQTQPRAELLARAGAELSASVGDAEAVVTGSTLVESFPAIFQIASALVSQSLIPPAVFDRQLPRIRAQSIGNNRRPAAELLAQVVFYGSDSADTSDSGLSSHDLAVRFYRERYLPAETFVGVVGDLSAADAFRVVEEFFGKWHAADARPPNPAPQAPTITSRAVIVPIAAGMYSRFTIGAATCDRRHPDYPALAVLDAVIGRRGAGRMFTSLREQKGYSYSQESELSAGDRPLWRAILSIRPEVSEIALRDMLDVVDVLRNELVPDGELRAKKRALVAELPVRLDGPSALLNMQLRRVMEDLPENYWDDYARQIDLVTSQDVRTVARKYLNADRLFVIAVGDPKILEPALANLGFAARIDDPR